MSTCHEQLETARGLLLEHLCDGEVNDLKISLVELLELAPGPDDPNDLKIPGAVPFGVLENSRRWSVTFEAYVCYSVRNETFAVNASADRWSGRQLRVLSDSAFLDYVKESTWANGDHPGPLSHYQFISANHIIDVVSANEPHIERVFQKPTSEGAHP